MWHRHPASTRCKRPSRRNHCSDLLNLLKKPLVKKRSLGHIPKHEILSLKKPEQESITESTYQNGADFFYLCTDVLATCGVTLHTKHVQQYRDSDRGNRSNRWEASFLRRMNTHSPVVRPSKILAAKVIISAIWFDEKNLKLNGSETVTYLNDSPNELVYLWLQMNKSAQQCE